MAAEAIQVTLRNLVSAIFNLGNSGKADHRDIITRLDGIAGKLIEVEMEQRVIIGNQAEGIRVLNALLNAIVEPTATGIEIVESDPTEQA